MKKMIKRMKIGDVLIIGFLVILSFLPIAMFVTKENQIADEDPKTNIVISVDGEEIHEMKLKNDHTRETYLYDDAAGHKNLIVRDGDQVYIKEASCSDELCVRQGTISEPGETIVCLPHTLIVEIVSTGPEAPDSGSVDLTS